MFRSVLIAIFFCILLAGCFQPMHDFDGYPHPQAPDYSKDECWAALPWKHDAADSILPGSGLKDGQADAKVDVFFVYPTLYYVGNSWNADVYDKKLNSTLDKTTISQQASVFNGSCRVFVPYYRQAILYAFRDKKNNGKKALDLAYFDVRRAFIYYMQNYNKGRPIIIAGHSQGTLMTYRLIKEFFDTTALKQKLVAAYLIGFKVVKDSLKVLKPSDSATQTCCYICWNTIKQGNMGNIAKFFSGVCVNPLTWKRDTNFGDASLNKGSLVYDWRHKYECIKPMVVGAACHNGVLWISKPDAPYFNSLAGSYHIFDYGFFYMNIRENVAQRVQAYLDKHPQNN